VSPPDRSRLGGLVAALVAVATLGAAWRPLFVDVPATHVAAICALAVLPLLALWSPRGRRLLLALGGLLALLAGLALALRASPVDLLGPAGWREVATLIPDGLAAASSSNLPVAHADEPALTALLDVALLGLAGAAAWQAAVRRTPIWAIVALGAGLAYRWTVLPPEQPLLAGAIGLAAALAVLALVGGPPASGRNLSRAASATAVGGLAVAAALAIGAGPARTDGAWLDWTSWELAGGAPQQVSALDLEQSYGQLDWSDEPRVVMRVRADRREHLRAAALESFDGVAFGLDYPGRYEDLPVRDGVLEVPGVDERSARRTSVEVTLGAARTNLLLSPGRPARFAGSVEGDADLLGESVRVQPPLGRGAAYTVDAWIPDPGPGDLVAAPAPTGLPAHLTEVRAGPGGHTVDVPLWGSGLPRPAPEDFGEYAPVVALAERVAGPAKTQYAAVNRIEAHLRRGYAYDERPPYPATGTLPIVDFVGTGRRGFCQHFAGSMTLMLRSLGIPSRVAVGYTGGSFDPDAGEWVILDRDAHSWVEVYFEGYGWIPFDPTPGRAVAGTASVSSPDYAPLRSVVEREGVEREAVDPPSRREAVPPMPVEPPPHGGGSGGGGGVGAGTAISSLEIALAALGGALALLVVAGPLLRAARRLRRRFGGDERARVLGAVRELEDELGRLSAGVRPTGTGSERAREVRAALGVDVAALYAMADEARYAGRPPAPGAGRRAWRELAAARKAIRARMPLGRRIAAALMPPRPGSRAEAAPDGTLTV
jgi:hypothetical protein